ncbi:uncharacterized protein LOC142570447 [Dermacentor variabilis]|uniref:uncharacterized protein LOC142570447 n=1 Tax=Dermacentor variabilis TaxID=34621 RepID=UPI003F5C6036
MWDASEVVAPTATQGPVACLSRVDHVAFSWTLVKCFTVVLLGFASGKARLVKGREVRALDLLASHVCLSALLFLNLSQLRLHAFEWRLVAALLLGKAALFALVAAASAALPRSSSRRRGEGRLATAGLHAIFVTQVNDFGIAYPLVESVFGRSHPDFAGYLYLVAPLSLVLFNPIGFFLAELQGLRSQRRYTVDAVETAPQKQSVAREFCKAAAWAVFKVLYHPHALSSLLAIAVNIGRSGEQLPAPLAAILKHYEFDRIVNQAKGLAGTRPLLILGDFNAPHTTWGYRFQSKRRKALAKAMEDHETALLNEPDVTTRRGNSAARDTTPDLSWLSGTLDVSWRSHEVDLGSDHSVIGITIRGSRYRAVLGTARITDWDKIRKFTQEQEKVSEEESGQAETQRTYTVWARDQKMTLDKFTQEIGTTSQTPYVDARLTHMWAARHSLTRWWKRQRHNRKLAKRIAVLTKQIAEHVAKLCKDNWLKTCDDLQGKLSTWKTSCLLRHLIDPLSSKTATNRNLTKVLNKYKGGGRRLLEDLKAKYLKTEKGQYPVPERYEGTDNEEQDRPFTMTELWTLLGDAFAAPVLFLLGYHIEKAFQEPDVREHLLPAFILSAVKSFALPMFLKVSVELMLYWSEAQAGVKDRANFAFLYGSAPTAPIVILYASQRGLPAGTLATGVGVCTMLSLPVMFATAAVISDEGLPAAGVSPHLQMRTALASLGGLSLLASAFKSAGVLLWLLHRPQSQWGHVAVFLVTCSQYASRAWTASLALSVFLLKYYNSPELTTHVRIMFFVAYGVPVILTAAVMIGGRLLCRRQISAEVEVPLFFNGECEAVASVVLLSVCAALIALCLLQHAYERALKTSFFECCCCCRSRRGFGAGPEDQCYEKAPPASKYDATLDKRNLLGTTARVRFNLPPSGHVSCPGKDDGASVKAFETEGDVRGFTLLIAVLFISILIGIFVSYGRLFLGVPYGIFRVLQLVDATLSLGQGLLVLLTCGLEGKLLSEAKARVLLLLRIAGKRRRPKERTVSAGLRNANEIACRQFNVYHRRAFEEFLDETEAGVPMSLARSGFHGHRLVDWLLDAGLVRSRDEGVVYGRRLLEGGLLVHMERGMHFYDGPYDYIFVF